MLNLSESDRKSLLANRYVHAVTATQVQFTSEFKVKAIKLHENGLGPQDVFLKLGVDPLIFLPGYPKKCIFRWKKILSKEGEKGLKEEQRGKSSTGRPKKSANSEKSLLERIAFLEAENDFLKKLRALEEKYADKKGSR